jgi:tetratricopeptide (TPR) repeat protein
MPENPRIEDLRRRVQADPASIAFAALAEEYRRLGRHDDAVEICRAGLLRHPAYLSARVTLGRALIETGDLDAAREQFETVLRSAPENIAATRGLAQIHERLGASTETEMDPRLAQLMREHTEAAAAAASASATTAATTTTPVPVPVPAPLATPVPAAAHHTLEPPAPLEFPEPGPFDLRESLELPDPAFDLPLSPPLGNLHFLEPELPESFDIPEPPDPASVAAISNLQRFLAAIQHARHA